MTSKREIQRRLEALEQANEATSMSPAPWMAEVPEALWDDPVVAWRYCLTDDDSHPNLDTED